MRCPKCNAKNDSDAVFCKKCGARMPSLEERRLSADRIWNRLLICLFTASLLLTAVVLVLSRSRSRQQKVIPGANLFFMVKGITFDMVYVKGGTFRMGGTFGHNSTLYDNEYPVHKVTLSDYYIGKYEVTQELWRTVMGSNPSHFDNDPKCPVEMVSYNECKVFYSRLNVMLHDKLPKGMHFALPTEAQWEYAARGGNNSKGTVYSGSNNRNKVAWYNDNSGGVPHFVGDLSSNELGICDMSGNVYEWCADRYGKYSGASQKNPTGSEKGSSYVLRGGGWLSSAEYCSVSSRSYNSPGNRYIDVGLRLALVR